jgi:hypothetical protein
MRDDLLDAQASVDWAVSQFKHLGPRLEAWRYERPYSISEKPDPEMGKKIIRFSNIKMPPRILNAEVGAIINSLRSSLDVLVNILARRNGHACVKDTQFPISPRRADFFEGKHAGRKQIKRLSNADRAIIESLEPWRGGDNPLLIALHDIDVARKHRRLIGVSATPQWMTVTPGAIETGLELVRGWPGFKNDTIIATANINAPNSEFHFSLQVTLDEAGPVSGQPVIASLNQFASLVNSIIELFDTP